MATTLHIAVLLLRAHRNPPGRRYDLLLAPSAVFAATPWLSPTASGLVAGLIVHFAWFVACDRLVPPHVVASAGPRAAVPAPPRSTATSAGTSAPAGFAATPVIGVFRETSDITTFRMARPGGFDFKAGQFVTVRIKIDGKPVVRCYSVSSAPEATGYLEISVKRQGLVSGTLHATVRPGSLLEVRNPAGGFAYPEGDQRPVTLIAGGVGITPMMCMLRHAAQADPTRPVTLLYSVHSQADIAFRFRLMALLRQLGRDDFDADLARRSLRFFSAHAIMRRRIAHLKKTKRLFDLWRVYPKPLAVLMAAIVTLHVAVIWYFGYAFPKG